jgi:membrane fusion protein (multidrug efflux system)
VDVAATRRNEKPGLAGSMSLAAIAVFGGRAYLYVTGGWYQSTDDACAQVATVSISANVGGGVSEIDERDNEIVQRGAMLFKLDDAPLRIAVDNFKSMMVLSLAAIPIVVLLRKGGGGNSEPAYFE